MNGYSNRETWATVLHITNNETIYIHLKNITRFERDNFQTVKNIVNRWAKDKDTFLPESSIRLMLDDIGDVSKVNWNEVYEALQPE